MMNNAGETTYGVEVYRKMKGEKVREEVICKEGLKNSRQGATSRKFAEIR